MLTHFGLIATNGFDKEREKQNDIQFKLGLSFLNPLKPDDSFIQFSAIFPPSNNWFAREFSG